MQALETQNSPLNISEDPSQIYSALKEDRRETGEEHLYQGLVGLDSQSKGTSTYVNIDEKGTTNPVEGSYENSQTYETLKKNRRETGDEHVYQGLVGLDSQSKDTSKYVNIDKKGTTNPGADGEGSYENTQTYETLKEDRRETGDEHIYQGLVGMETQDKDTSKYVNIDEKGVTKPSANGEDSYENLPQSFVASESTSSKN